MAGIRCDGLPAGSRCSFTACCFRYTKDIPPHGSASGQDGKPVIFPYIDLNIQTLQSNQLRSSAAAAPGGLSQQQAPANGSVPSVTPARPGLNAVRGPAGGVPEAMVAPLSEALLRIATAGQIFERVGACHTSSFWLACLEPRAQHCDCALLWSDCSLAP